MLREASASAACSGFLGFRDCGLGFMVYISISIWLVVKVMVPFWGTVNISGRIIIGIQKGAIILTTTHTYIHM